MFLIDKPFVSDFLIETIKANNFNIIATKVAKELVTDDTLAWISEEQAAMMIKDNPELPIYSNSENALEWVQQHLGDTELAKQIKVLKDKVKFRTVIQNLYPDFFFQEIALAAIHQLSLADIAFPFVIKPSIGFFSIGVHIVKNEADWVAAKKELHPANLKSIFPASVLNTANFIIEEFIEGEEYAIDYYYDSAGKVVLLNVLHHLFSSGTDTSDRVYSTSKSIIQKYKVEIESFLTKIGQELNLTNFPAHAEIRIDKKGKIIPIEINPLRFGGWCTTGDLLGFTLGFNAYQSFLQNKQPNWEQLFEGKEDKKFSIIILNNSSGIPPANISGFDYAKLAKDFENPVLMRPLSIHKFPVFGFVFTETSPKNENELIEILTSDLKKYINRLVSL